MVNEAKLDTEKALEFMLAGNATFTIRSMKTGARYTYKVQQPKEGDTRWFVKLLTGPENTSDYKYLGMIDNADKKFRLTGKSTMKSDSLPVKAFDWFFSLLVKHIEPKNVEIWHAGRCGRCGRVLTVPESVELGLGPECAGRI